MSSELTLDDLPQPAEQTTVHPDELEVDGDNPNEQTDEMFGLLCENMREYGWIGNAIVTNTDGVIADGEHRWRAAQEIGLTEVPVKFYDIDDATRRLWRQELNKISGEHDAKRDALEYDYLLNSGKSDEVHELTSAADEDLDELLDEIKLKRESTPLYEYDPDHNVYFEDCVEGMRERLEDDSVDCVIADPPYGFSFGGRGEQDFDDIKNAESWELFEDFLSESARVLSEGAHIYMWWSWQHYGRMEQLFRRFFDHHNTLVWVKESFGLNGGKKYRPQHEFCFYGSVGDPAPLKNATSSSDVLEFSRADTSEYDHPTEKPVPMIAELLKNSTSRNDLVCDPFMGSGTTAVAAIQNNRDYVGFELDEDNYRSVIERRIGEAKRQVEANE